MRSDRPTELGEEVTAAMVMRASGAEPPRGPSHVLDPETRMEALSRRGATLRREGRWEEAAAAFDELFGMAVEAGSAAWLADALRWLASVRGVQRRFEEAEELAALCAIVAGAHGLALQAARATNLLGTFRHEQGDLDGAYSQYETALERAREIGDHQLIGIICQNLGVHANTVGDLRAARVLYLESIAGTLASGDETNLAMAYNNLGMVCTDLREWLEAEVYFDRGVEVAGRLGDRAQLARLYANRAEPLIRTGEVGRARESLGEAESLASQLGAGSTLATIGILRGLAARLAGEWTEAEMHVQAARSIARGGTLPLAEAEALAELAQIRRAQGRLAEAHAEAVAARSLFRRLGAARDAAELTLLLEEIERAGAL